MAKRVSRQTMTAHDWLVLSDRGAIRERMASDPYSMVYPALLSHFSGIQVFNWDAAVLGLHIVYGWMPTIPKLAGIMKWNAVTQRKLVAALKNARNGQAPTDDELKTLKSFCNNSMVGASKLLHFFQPGEFPIWDSRVAKVFLRQSKARWRQANRIEKWKNYRASLKGWLSNRAVTNRCGELRKLASFLHQVSNLRLVELVMFHETESKRKQASA